MKSKFLHIILATVLTGILSMHSVSNIVTISTFLMNQDLIAKTLCIQKDDQQGCNGKCQLMKELTNHNLDSNSKAPVQSGKRLVLDVFQVSQISNLEQFWIDSEVKKSTPSFKHINHSDLFLDIDTPPPILS